MKIHNKMCICLVHQVKSPAIQSSSCTVARVFLAQNWQQMLPSKWVFC